MAADTASFFSEGTSVQFKRLLDLYPQVLRLKAETKRRPEELIKLDAWYQNELPKKLKSRGKDAHCTDEELIMLMKWKQARGKSYPQLNYLIKVNTPRAVMAETKKAFRKLPNIESAIVALSNLKGVGTTMASALLAAASPDIAPFMADECILSIPDIESIDYTTKEYLKFVNHIQATADRLNKQCETSEWTLHKVELALWTHFVASELKPELLEGICEVNGKRNNPLPYQNGDVAKVTDESDDSNLEANEASPLTANEDSMDKTLRPTPPDVEDTNTNDSILTTESIDGSSTSRQLSELDDELTNDSTDGAFNYDAQAIANGKCVVTSNDAECSAYPDKSITDKNLEVPIVAQNSVEATNDSAEQSSAPNGEEVTSAQLNADKDVEVANIANDCAKEVVTSNDSAQEVVTPNNCAQEVATPNNCAQEVATPNNIAQEVATPNNCAQEVASTNECAEQESDDVPPPVKKCKVSSQEEVSCDTNV